MCLTTMAERHEKKRINFDRKTETIRDVLEALAIGRCFSIIFLTFVRSLRKCTFGCAAHLTVQSNERIEIPSQ